MALVTTADYKVALYKVLHNAQNGYGIIPEELVRHEGMPQADLDTILADYKTWRLALGNRINGTHSQAAKP